MKSTANIFKLLKFSCTSTYNLFAFLRVLFKKVAEVNRPLLSVKKHFFSIANIKIQFQFGQHELLIEEGLSSWKDLKNQIDMLDTFGSEWIFCLNQSSGRRGEAWTITRIIVDLLDLCGTTRLISVNNTHTVQISNFF